MFALKTHKFLRWYVIQKDTKPRNLDVWVRRWGQEQPKTAGRIPRQVNICPTALVGWTWVNIGTISFTNLEIFTQKGRGGTVHREGGMSAWRACQPVGPSSPFLCRRWWIWNLQATRTKMFPWVFIAQHGNPSYGLVCEVVSIGTGTHCL